jgi:hypothetical protein
MSSSHLSTFKIISTIDTIIFYVQSRISPAAFHPHSWYRSSHIQNQLLPCQEFFYKKTTQYTEHSIKKLKELEVAKLICKKKS